jgi:hypothetical protein
MFIRSFFSPVFLCVFCFSLANNTYTADPSIIDTLPNELLTEILVYAYAHYEDLTFKGLAAVSQRWHTIISNQKFLPTCKTHGWEKPVIIVCKMKRCCMHYCFKNGLHLPNCYEEMGEKNPYDNGILDIHLESKEHPLNNTILFDYCGSINVKLKSNPEHPAAFATTENTDFCYLGIWINPQITYVYNKYSLYDYKKHEASKKILSKYIQEGYIKEQLPSGAHVVFRESIPASRIIKKAPQQYQHVEKNQQHSCMSSQRSPYMSLYSLKTSARFMSLFQYIKNQQKQHDNKPTDDKS